MTWEAKFEMSDGILTPSDRDFEVLRSSRTGALGRLAFASMITGLALYAVFIVGVFFWGLQNNSWEETPERYRRLQALQHDWSDTAAADWFRYRQWMVNHGTASELFIFDVTSGSILSSILAANAADLPAASMGIGSKIFIAIHLFTIRILFVVLAGMRFITAVCLVCFVAGFQSLRVRTRTWLLGQTGNGRLYYSGVRATLSRVTDDGSPDMLVNGLACPNAANWSVVQSTSLGKLIDELGVSNETNRKLAGIIYFYRDIVAYLDDSKNETGLLENTTILLAEMSKAYMDIIEPSGQKAPRGSIAESLLRTLTEDSASALRQVGLNELVTLVLGLEAAKVFAHSYEGGAWIKKSSLPHLSARAILHSLPSYPDDYNHSARLRIRQGLIYAQRYSAFSEVRLPINIEDDSYALRQWSEVIMATPGTRAVVADEVELYGLLRQAHVRWTRQLSGIVDSLVSAGSIRTGTDLVFVRLEKLVPILKSLLSSQERERLYAVAARVGESQKTTLEKQRDDELVEVATYRLKLARFVEIAQKAESISRDFELDVATVQEWLSLRLILSSYGWLASRIGEYSVPLASVLSAVFHPVSKDEGGNERGRLGIGGVVALRGSQFNEFLGDRWKSRIRIVERVVMAESRELYERLLRGESRDEILSIDEKEADTNSHGEGN